MTRQRLCLAFAATAAVAVFSLNGLAQSKQKKHEGAPAIGYDDTPVLPGQPWKVHDIKRPHPRMVTAGPTLGPPPSDAVVLFDGKDLSKWIDRAKDGKTSAPSWTLGDGYFEVKPGTGSLYSKEKFGSAQIHVEWAAPAKIESSSQLRGNSGVLIMSVYEVQVLDSWNNVTYADGQAGAIYGQWPPLVNPARKPGEWQSFDIVFEAPKFEGDKLVKPAYETIFYNGVLVHHHQQVIGRMIHRKVATYAPHEPEEPLGLQNHGTQVRYRNIWVRRLAGYDRPE